MFDVDKIAIMIPIIALLIPVIAILTTHQRKMAELIHGGTQNRQSSQEILALRHEIAELRSLVHQQSIAVDNLVSRSVVLPSETVEQRLR
jgi:Mg2+ and Co2+ transporter CorA